MAKQTTILHYSGKLGKKIGYKCNGKYYERSMPENVKQTSATRRAARRFGLASQTGAIIRKAFTSEMDIHCDSRHINRFTKTLIPSAGTNLDHLKGFRFNQHTGTERFFTIAPKLSRDGILHIPQQTRPVTKGITALEIKVIGVRIDSTTKQVTGKDITLITIPTNEPFAGAALPLNIPGTGTLLVTLQIRGLYKDGPSGNKQHIAADIIEVQEPQVTKIRNKPSYPPLLSRLRSRLPGSPNTYIHTLHSVLQRE